MKRIAFAHIEKTIDFTDKESIYKFVEEQGKKNFCTQYMYVDDGREYYTSHFEEKCINELTGGGKWKYTIVIKTPYGKYNSGW